MLFEIGTLVLSTPRETMGILSGWFYSVQCKLFLQSWMFNSFLPMSGEVDCES